MMRTADLVERLVRDAGPVRPLNPAWSRTLSWLILAVGVIAAIVVAISPRPDLAVQARETRYVVEQLAALATAVLAAHSALSLSIPGTSRLIAMLPLAPALVWLASQGAGCLAVGADLSLGREPECLPLIALCGTIPALILVDMLRRGLAVHPRLNLFLAALAAGALGNVALRLFHAQDAALIVLIWQTGSVVLLSLCGAALGRFVLP